VKLRLQTDPESQVLEREVGKYEGCSVPESR